MKITIGHHVKLKGLPNEKYHKFCQKALDDGVLEGRYNPIQSVHDIPYQYVGVHENNKLIFYDNYFTLNCPSKLLTIEQALEEGAGFCHYHEKHKDLFDAIVELKVIKSQIAKLQEREAELSKFIADDLELG